MCGIAGWVDYNRDLRDTSVIMDKISEVLSPRGPDGKGKWSAYEAVFVHRRLSVIDLEMGKQPMERVHNGVRYVIVYNGELYNTEEIRAKLIVLGFDFRSHSDTEVLLTAYIAWGERCVDELNGIYAFGVWNDRDKTLFLARDRIGVKPLFFYKYDGGIIFASEIKALLSHPFIKPVIDENGIADIMLLGPARKPGYGVFKNISEIMPANMAILSKDKFIVHQYWKLTAKPHTEDIYETIHHTRDLLFDSIKRQLVSDVPVCTFLSGGLDSSIISAVASKEFMKRNELLTTYSVDYKDNNENFVASKFQPDQDAPWIIEMSKHINSYHRDYVIDTPMLIDALDDAVIARDLPGMADVDSSLLLFCRHTKKHFKVAISGECADEIFGGYPWYHDEDILFSDGFPWARSTDDRLGLLREGILKDIGGREYVKDCCDETISETDYLDSDSVKERRMREMFMLNYKWFMQTLLDRKDRMSMMSGLEARVPFCDHRLTQYAYNIPWEMKAYKGREKGLLRQAMSDILPRDVAWRKKSPFPKTHNPIYLEEVRGRLKAVLDGKDCRLTEICDEKKLRELIDDYSVFKNNWYGQLMTTPQTFAYLLQIEFWMRRYNVTIE